MSNIFFFKAALWWNKLPKKIKEILNITYFKLELGNMIKPLKAKQQSWKQLSDSTQSGEVPAQCASV